MQGWWCQNAKWLASRGLEVQLRISLRRERVPHVVSVNDEPAGIQGTLLIKQPSEEEPLCEAIPGISWEPGFESRSIPESVEETCMILIRQAFSRLKRRHPVDKKHRIS